MYISFDFTPVTVKVFVAPTATPAAYKIATCAVAISGGLVTLTLDGGVDFAATDDVTLVVTD